MLSIFLECLGEAQEISLLVEMEFEGLHSLWQKLTNFLNLKHQIINNQMLIFQPERPFQESWPASLLGSSNALLSVKCNHSQAKQHFTERVIWPNALHFWSCDYIISKGNACKAWAHLAKSMESHRAGNAAWGASSVRAFPCDRGPPRQEWALKCPTKMAPSF